METDPREMHWSPAKVAGVILAALAIIAYLVLPVMLGETRPPSDPLPSAHDRF